MVAHPPGAHFRRGTEPGLQANCARKGPEGPFLWECLSFGGPSAQADLPSIRVIFVPHTGQVPWAADRPLGRSFFSPSNSRLVRHLTQ